MKSIRFHLLTAPEWLSYNHLAMLRTELLFENNNLHLFRSSVNYKFELMNYDCRRRIVDSNVYNFIFEIKAVNHYGAYIIINVFNLINITVNRQVCSASITKCFCGNPDFR